MEPEVKKKIITNIVTAVWQTEDNRIFVHQTSLQKGKAPKEVITVIKPEEAKKFLDALFFSQTAQIPTQPEKSRETAVKQQNSGVFESIPEYRVGIEK